MSGRVIDSGGALEQSGAGRTRLCETMELAYDKLIGDETRPFEGQLFLFLPYYEVLCL